MAINKLLASPTDCTTTYLLPVLPTDPSCQITPFQSEFYSILIRPKDAGGTFAPDCFDWGLKTVSSYRLRLIFWTAYCLVDHMRWPRGLEIYMTEI